MAILKKLNHEGIVKYIDHFEVDGKFCIVTEFIPGKTLRTSMQSYPESVMPIAFVQMFLLDIVQTLAYAHSLGVRHGDIKSGERYFFEEFLKAKKNQNKTKQTNKKKKQIQTNKYKQNKQTNKNYDKQQK